MKSPSPRSLRVRQNARGGRSTSVRTSPDVATERCHTGIPRARSPGCTLAADGARLRQRPRRRRQIRTARWYRGSGLILVFNRLERFVDCLLDACRLFTKVRKFAKPGHPKRVTGIAARLIFEARLQCVRDKRLQRLAPFRRVRLCLAKEWIRDFDRCFHVTHITIFTGHAFRKPREREFRSSKKPANSAGFFVVPE